MGFLALSFAKKQSTVLIKLVAGPLQAHATLNKSPIFFDGQTYTPEPAIDIKLPKQGISLEEEPCIITLPLARTLNTDIRALAEMLGSLRSSPLVKVFITSIRQATKDETVYEHLYAGILDKSRKNPSKKRQQIELEFLPELHYRLEDVSLGRRADPDCDLIFGPQCGIDTSQFFSGPGPYTGQIRRAWVRYTPSSYRNSRLITINIDSTLMPGVTNDALFTQPEGWWVRSFLEADGVRIPIQEWETGTHNFVLNRVPPLSWETPGRAILLVPGCPRTAVACTQRNNLNNFGGLGFGIPAYNPTLEVRE